jgi:ATP-dependent protease ClpP protease subunit
MNHYRIEGYIGEGEATAAALAEALARAGGGPVEIVVNSPGGIATEGAAMHAELRRHAGRKTVLVAGLAASAASLVAMAGDEIVMAEGALMMIHDPAGMTWGPAAAHRHTAGVLDKMTATYARLYATASGHPVARVARWMADETWMTAAEAVALNFADRAIEPAEPVIYAAADYGRFRNAPPELLRLAAKNGWTAVPSDRGERVSHA